MDEISYDAVFPRVRMTFRDRALPFAVQMEAWSPFIPHDANLQRMPFCAACGRRDGVGPTDTDSDTDSDTDEWRDVVPTSVPRVLTMHTQEQRVNVAVVGRQAVASVLALAGTPIENATSSGWARQTQRQALRAQGSWD